MRRLLAIGPRAFLVAAVAVATFAAPASGAPGDRAIRQSADRPAPRLATGALGDLAAAAESTALLDELEARLRDQPDVERFEWWMRRFVSDWSGDGRADDVALHQVFTVEGTSFRTKATIRAVEGDTGRLLWTRRWSRDDDTIFFTIEAAVGKRGLPGVIVVEVSGFRFETTGIEYRFTAFTGRGKKLWRRSFASSITGSWPISYTATDYIVSFGTFDGLRGRATDMLFASGTVIVPPTWELQSGVVKAFALDGAGGSVVEHPVPQVGAGFVPFTGTMGDFDGDGLDDYVFVNERPNVVPGEDGGTEPVAVGTGVVDARRGTDGTPLWTGGGLDFSGRNVTLTNLGDVVGSKEGDVFVETMAQLLSPGNPDDTQTYLVEGASGALVWQRRGLWPYSPGDIDGDGRRDVLTQHYWSDDGYVATKVRAFTNTGHPLWRREYRTEHPLQQCCSWLIHWGGGWGVGDYDGDAASDGFIWHSAGGIGATGLEDEVRQFVIDAASGRILVKGDEELQALGKPPVDGGTSDYARVRWNAGAVTVDVYDGTTQRMLTSSELAFDVPLPPHKTYVYVESGRLDGDRCAEIAVSVSAPGGQYEVMLDGSDGSVLWWRSIGLRDGSARLAGSNDSNDAC